MKMWKELDIPNAGQITLGGLTKYEWYVLWHRALGSPEAEAALVKLTQFAKDRA